MVEVFGAEFVGGVRLPLAPYINFPQSYSQLGLAFQWHSRSGREEGAGVGVLGTTATATKTGLETFSVMRVFNLPGIKI